HRDKPEGIAREAEDQIGEQDERRPEPKATDEDPAHPMVGAAPGRAVRLHLRHALERFLDLRGRVLVVLELAGQMRLVRAQIEMAVARQVEANGPGIAVTLGALSVLVSRAE